MVKCEDGCPFLLYLSKDGSNPDLVVKTLVPTHNCYRIFKNPRASAKIYISHAFQVKNS